MKTFKITKETKKAAFTLAEVLITLGIVGVIAAMTIPDLMHNMQYKHLQVELKKTYSELNQMSKLFMDQNEMSVHDYANAYGYTALDKEISKYIKGWHNTGKSWSTFNYKSLNSRNVTSFLCDQSTFREDMVGRFYNFDDPISGNFNGTRLCVDINGIKKPNVIGLDVFTFRFTLDGRVIPEGQDDENNNYARPLTSGGTAIAESKYCNGWFDTSSLACSYYAINDKSPKGNGSYWKNFVKSF
jgi:prepilin-type N-terminal cleavage/methylation domain-containing protein